MPPDWGVMGTRMENRGERGVLLGTGQGAMEEYRESPARHPTRRSDLASYRVEVENPDRGTECGIRAFGNSLRRATSEREGRVCQLKT